MVATSTSFVNLNFHAKNFREKSDLLNFGNWFVGVETTKRG